MNLSGTSNAVARLTTALKTKSADSDHTSEPTNDITDSHAPPPTGIAGQQTTSERLGSTPTALDVLRGGPAPRLTRISPASAANDDPSDLLEVLSDIYRELIQRIEIDKADARVLAAGDNYDQVHIINPRTGNEYTDAEARDASTPEGIELAKLLDADYPAFGTEPRGLERRLDSGTIDSEPYAVAAGYFYQSPELLATASPELYALMVRTTGVDPLATTTY